MNRLTERSRMAAAFTLAFAAAFGTAYLRPWTYAVGAISESSASGGLNVVELARTKQATEVPEIGLVYIGSSTCGAARDPSLPATVAILRDSLQARAERLGYAFTTIGIARDWRVKAGLEHLDNVASFDEVFAGRNWLNSGVIHYAWADLPGAAATPQVVVVGRLATVPGIATAGGTTGYGVKDERVLMRKVGLVELERWARSGVPLDLAVTAGGEQASGASVRTPPLRPAPMPFAIEHTD